MSDEKTVEQEFHDQYYQTHGRNEFPPTRTEFLEYVRRSQLIPFYEGGWSYWSELRAEVLADLGDVRGKRLLDYGCGIGQMGLYFALQGAQVWGFDLSPVGIEIANEMCTRYRLDARFQTMDAERLDYPDDFFDLVLGFGVLHHVIKYPHAARQVFRVLKSGGRAIFAETLWDNPLINYARRFTSLEGAGDAALTERLILEFGRPFRKVILKKRHLLYMLKRLSRLPARDRHAALQPRPLWSALYRLDQRLLRVKPLQRYCGEVIIEIQR